MNTASVTPAQASTGTKLSQTFRRLTRRVAIIARWIVEPTATKTIRLIAALTMVVIVAVLTAFLLRIAFPKSLIEIGRFEVLSSPEKKLDGEKALSDLVADRVHRITEEAAEFSGNAFASRGTYSSLPDLPRIPVETSQHLEYRGVSSDQLLAIWRHLRNREYRVSGDVVPRSDGHQQLILRYTSGGRGNTFTTDMVFPDLEQPIKRLSLQLVGDIEPEVAARYLMQELVTCSSDCGASTQDAIQFCFDWLQREPQNALPNYYLGFAFAQNHQPQEALDFLERSIELGNNSFAALNAKGSALTDLGRFQDAAASFQSALQQKEIPTATLNLGILAQRQGNYGEAEKWFRKAIAADKDYSGVYSALGNLLMFTSRNEEAAEAFRNALKLAPERPGFARGLVQALASAGHTQEAITVCDHSLGLNSSDPAFIARKAMAFVLLNRPDEAIEQVHRIDRKTKMTSDVPFQFALAFLEKGDLTTAFTIISENTQETDADMRFAKAKLLELKGDLAASKAELEQVELLSKGYAFFQPDALELSVVTSRFHKLIANKVNPSGTPSGR